MAGYLVKEKEMKKKIEIKDGLYTKEDLIEKVLIFMRGMGPALPTEFEKRIREVLSEKTRDTVEQILLEGITFRDNLKMEFKASGLNLHEFCLRKSTDMTKEMK
jgi:hypothetical protein